MMIRYLRNDEGIMIFLHIRTFHTLTSIVNVGVGKRHNDLPTFIDPFHAGET